MISRFLWWFATGPVKIDGAGREYFFHSSSVWLAVRLSILFAVVFLLANQNEVTPPLAVWAGAILIGFMYGVFTLFVLSALRSLTKPYRRGDHETIVC